jgi:hypothetical protein
MSQFFGMKSGNKLEEEAPKTETRRFSQFLRKSLKLEKETETLSTATQPGSGHQSSEIDSFQQLQLMIQQEDEENMKSTKLQKKISSKNTTKSPRNDPSARKSLSFVQSLFKKSSPRNEQYSTNTSGSLTPNPQLRDTVSREFNNEETFKINFKEEKKDKRKSFISTLFSKK